MFFFWQKNDVFKKYKSWQIILWFIQLIVNLLVEEVHISKPLYLCENVKECLKTLVKETSLKNLSWQGNMLRKQI